MLYDAILIDSFNLGYRLAKKGQTSKDIAKSVIYFIENKVKLFLNKEGNIYLLFDPMSKNDLGMSKSFKYKTVREEINTSYKSNRKRNPEVYEAMNLVTSFYAFRGEHIKTVVDKFLEADDFVEGILEIEKDKKVAMVTTDYDWSRYITDKVHMINEGFENPFTVQSYIDKFGFKPTIAAVTVKKAIYGDRSDGISSLISLKKSKFTSSLEDVADELIKYLSESNISLAEFKKRYLSIDLSIVLSKLDKDPIEELYFVLHTAIVKSEEVPADIFFSNIRLIESRAKDIKDNITWGNIKKDHNDLMDVTYGFTQTKKTFRFGGFASK